MNLSDVTAEVEEKPEEEVKPERGEAGGGGEDEEDEELRRRRRRRSRLIGPRSKARESVIRIATKQ